MQINNYVKLYVRSPGLASRHWLFPFGDSGKKALAAAQKQRTALRKEFSGIAAEAFQLSTFAPSGLRGVPVVGEPIRALEVVDAA